MRSYYENYAKIDDVLDEIEYIFKNDLKSCKALKFVIKSSLIQDKIENIFSKVKAMQNKDSILHSLYKSKKYNNMNNENIFYSIMIIH